jgi:hypothetical protein
MRKIDWTEPLSNEDIAFLRQVGVQGMEERIQAHQAYHGAEVPPDLSGDELLIAQQQASTPEPEDDTFEDDYDSWKVAELEAEVTNRDAIEGTSNVLVNGTGKDGKVLKSDLVYGLRAWDRENPNALD